jgi:GNAT superfamily N-acetyltransferase
MSACAFTVNTEVDDIESAQSTTFTSVEASDYPHAKPWYRAVLAGEEPVGFAMLSWNVEPQPPEIIVPWFLWKLFIDERHQGRGYGREVMRQVAELVRAEGATELFTSYVPDDGWPGSTSGSGSYRLVSSTGTVRSSCA